jgi:hypothetical protein
MTPGNHEDQACQGTACKSANRVSRSLIRASPGDRRSRSGSRIGSTANGSLRTVSCLRPGALSWRRPGSCRTSRMPSREAGHEVSPGRRRVECRGGRSGHFMRSEPSSTPNVSWSGGLSLRVLMTRDASAESSLTSICTQSQIESRLGADADPMLMLRALLRLTRQPPPDPSVRRWQTRCAAPPPLQTSGLPMLGSAGCCRRLDGQSQHDRARARSGWRSRQTWTSPLSAPPSPGPAEPNGHSSSSTGTSGFALTAASTSPTSNAIQPHERSP